MGIVLASTAVSLDGFIAGPNHEMDSAQAGPQSVTLANSRLRRRVGASINHGEGLARQAGNGLNSAGPSG